MTRLLCFLSAFLVSLNLLSATSPRGSGCIGHPHKKGDSSFNVSTSKGKKIYVKNEAIKIAKNGIVLQINDRTLLLNGIFSDKKGLFFRPENIVSKGFHDIVCWNCNRPYDIVRYGNRCPRCGKVQLSNPWEKDDDD